MPGPDLLNWIKSAEAKGLSSTQIKDSLLKAGYAESDINEALNTLPQAKPASARTMPAVAAAVALIIIIGAIGAYLALTGEKEVPMEEAKPQENTGNNEIIKNPIENPFYKEKNEDGIVTDELHGEVRSDMIDASECSDMECFNERFMACEQSSLTIESEGNTAYTYIIVSPVLDRCRVISRSTANPNPDWVGKEMACLFDNSQDFETAKEDMSGCEGELYYLILSTNP